MSNGNCNQTLYVWLYNCDRWIYILCTHIDMTGSQAVSSEHETQSHSNQRTVASIDNFTTLLRTVFQFQNLTQLGMSG